MIRPVPLSLLILLATLLLSPAAMAKNPAPEGRTYFVFIMGLDDAPYGVEADCLTFDATQACTPDGQTCLDGRELKEADRLEKSPVSTWLLKSRMTA